MRRTRVMILMMERVDDDARGGDDFERWLSELRRSLADQETIESVGVVKGEVELFKAVSQ